jgi:hypothetical protein
MQVVVVAFGQVAQPALVQSLSDVHIVAPHTGSFT